MFKQLIGIFIFIYTGHCIKHPEPYYGVKIGPLIQYAHGINGTAYGVDESTIFIKNFSYDGTGPDAFFWIGNSPRPSPEGTIIPYPEDYVGRDPPVLSAYNNADVILRLPMGKRIRDIRWLSVWCRRFTVDFGEVFIPPNLEVPKPRVLPEFKRLAHGLRSDNISILDARTFYIPNLHYDGAGPDAYFWVGNGTEPTPFGLKVPNEMNSLDPLRGYQGEDIEIQLPGSLTVYDIDWLAVWCVQYRHNFGHVLIPKDLDVPPALGQTKISPAWWYNPTSTTVRPFTSTNCREFLDKRLQVRWEMKNDTVEITLAAVIREDQYVAFGLSGDKNRPKMVGGDVTVAYYNTELKTFNAIDYYMADQAQCDGKRGVCPDERIGGRNDVTILSGDRKDGVTVIKYSRPLQTNEAVNDRPIPANEYVNVIAAFGPLNKKFEANAHSLSGKTVDDIKINFGSTDDHQCINSLNILPDEKKEKWPPREIIGENIFTARIGPTGGSRGYSSITGSPSWGIAWYINDLLIPELTLERGQNYTFIVEGGYDNSNPARYHPFYITDSPEGGFGQKSVTEQTKQKVYAGVGYDAKNYPFPTAAGRLCEWAPKDIDRSETSETFEDYKNTLQLRCEQNGESAYLNWTVPMDAPDILYYQCYTHNNLGWKIHIVEPGYISQHKPNSARATSISIFALSIIGLLSISAITIHIKGRIF